MYKVDCQCNECDDYTVFNLSEQELIDAWNGNYDKDCKRCKAKGVSFYPVDLLHEDGSKSRADDLAEKLFEQRR